MRATITLLLAFGLATPASGDEGAQVFRFGSPDTEKDQADQQADPPKDTENDSQADSRRTERSAQGDTPDVAPSDSGARKLYDRLLNKAESPDQPLRRPRPDECR